MTLEPLILKMISYDHGCPGRIQHFLKVHSFAKTIAVFEHLDEKTLFITETAAIVHDIGIRLCLEKYGDGNGKLQEKEGPALAEQMLSELGFEKDVIERVSFFSRSSSYLYRHRWSRLSDSGGGRFSGQPL